MSHPTIHRNSTLTSALASAVHDKLPAAQRHEQIKKQSQKWVAQSFFGTLLKQARESPFRSKLFNGGRDGEAYGTLFDQHLADHMARGAGHKLSDSIARRIEAKAGYAKPAAARKPGPVANPSRRSNVPAALRA